MNDKSVEQRRYEERAKKIIANNVEFNKNIGGLFGIKHYLRKPYLVYLDMFSSRLRSTDIVLEIGAGTGRFTGELLKTGACVHATDISPKSLDVLKFKYDEFDNLRTAVADMESLPFPDAFFDGVVCSGSLSYGVNIIVMNEIHRVMKKGGIFICVDSLNDNPVYKWNRYLNYLLGRRSRSTLEMMPTSALLREYEKKFSKTSFQFFGSVSYLMPALAFLIGPKVAASVSDFVDARLNVRKSAFKFVFYAKK